MSEVTTTYEDPSGLLTVVVFDRGVAENYIHGHILNAGLRLVEPSAPGEEPTDPIVLTPERVAVLAAPFPGSDDDE